MEIMLVSMMFLLKPQVYIEVRGEGYDDIPDYIKVEIRL